MCPSKEIQVKGTINNQHEEVICVEQSRNGTFQHDELEPRQQAEAEGEKKIYSFFLLSIKNETVFGESIWHNDARFAFTML